MEHFIGFAILFLLVFFGWSVGVDAVPDIRKYEEEAYCETVKVNNKEFTRCLKAVEVEPELLKDLLKGK